VGHRRPGIARHRPGRHWPLGDHDRPDASGSLAAVGTDAAHGYYVVGNGLNPTVAELSEAAAVATGAPGAVPGSVEEARARLGDYFAELLLLDQGTTATRARSELGWLPTRPGLVDEYRHGSYRR
jgi:nucleoside-diphosphate-sugar epimerase